MPDERSIIILGATGMLGRSAYRLFAASKGWRVVGTARSSQFTADLPRSETAKVVTGVDVADTDRIIQELAAAKPDIILNCIGIIKQLDAAKNALMSISTNSLLPHRLAIICESIGARLVHVSTDCVFDGQKGFYKESDAANAQDLYGRTKLLGEVDYPHAVTLRTSIIGHEAGSAVSLVDWFLNQPGPRVKGYRKAIYSGLPTVELARVVRDVVAPRPDLRGLWHVASDPINKYELLKLVASAYGKSTIIDPDDALVIDRSLDGSRFRGATGYVAPSWPELVAAMHAHR
ncbi:MAG: SDR family oxidoreductase [Phreatobacter sp.]|nr:SDR family oxidoreductase [Phreatobacter sp.]